MARYRCASPVGALRVWSVQRTRPLPRRSPIACEPMTGTVDCPSADADGLPIRSVPVALAVLVLSAPFAGASSTGGRSCTPAVATSAQIRAFVERAARGQRGSFAASYDLRVPGGLREPHSLSRADLIAQRSEAVFAYHEEGPGSEAGAAHFRNYDVFVDFSTKTRLTNAGHGAYTCSRGHKRANWSCSNDSKDLAGGIAHLEQEYPPEGFSGEIQNMVFGYTVGRSGIRRERGYLMTRMWRHQQIRCLDFRSIARPVAFACLDRRGLVARFAAPLTVSDGPFLSGLLVWRSGHVSRNLLRLPAMPSPTG